jgi:hypothetical protein
MIHFKDTLVAKEIFNVNFFNGNSILKLFLLKLLILLTYTFIFWTFCLIGRKKLDNGNFKRKRINPLFITLKITDNFKEGATDPSAPASLRH